MAILIPNEKCLILLIKNFWLAQYAAGYHPGPLAPPRTDGASLGVFLRCHIFEPRITRSSCDRTHDLHQFKCYGDLRTFPGEGSPDAEAQDPADGHVRRVPEPHDEEGPQRGRQDSTRSKNS